MRLSAALEGNLDQILKEETRAATHGAREGIRKGTDVLKSSLRSQVTRAGLGRRLANTWRGKFFDNDRGFSVAGFVYSKAQTIVRAHAEGVTIRPKRGRYLAIPTASAPRRGANPRKRISPSNWPTTKLGPLRWVGRKSGPDLLVADEVRLGKTGRVSKARRTKTGRMGRGATTTVMFILVRQITLKKRLDINSAESRISRLLPQMILRAYRDTGKVTR